MSDVSTLLLNQIRKSMEELQKSGVGFIDSENSEGILYLIDGRHFYVQVKDWNE